MKTTFLSGPDGRPTFAVLHYRDYVSLVGEREAEAQLATALQPSGNSKRFIHLPNGGGERLDMVHFIDFWRTFKIDTMAILARAQIYSKFEHTELNGLDPVIRRVFLPEDSPYKNTMQAVTQVVDQIVDTGAFRRAKIDIGYYRPVNAIKIDWKEADEFIRVHRTEDDIFAYPHGSYLY